MSKKIIDTVSLGEFKSYLYKDMNFLNESSKHSKYRMTCHTNVLNVPSVFIIEGKRYVNGYFPVALKTVECSNIRNKVDYVSKEYSGSGVTIKCSNQGYLTVNGTVTSQFYYNVTPNTNPGNVKHTSNFYASHKYYARASLVHGGGRDYFYFLGSYLTFNSASRFFQPEVDQLNQTLYYTAAANVVFDNRKIFLTIYDLTEIFGAGNEPTLESDERIIELIKFETLPGRKVLSTTISGFGSRAANGGEIVYYDFNDTEINCSFATSDKIEIFKLDNGDTNVNRLTRVLKVVPSDLTWHFDSTNSIFYTDVIENIVTSTNPNVMGDVCNETYPNTTENRLSTLDKVMSLCNGILKVKDTTYSSLEDFLAAMATNNYFYFARTEENYYSEDLFSSSLISFVQCATREGSQLFLNTTGALTSQLDFSLDKNEEAGEEYLTVGDVGYEAVDEDHVKLNKLIVPLSQVKNEKTIIKLADKYDVTVGNEFELFYKGMLNTHDYKEYKIQCACDIGYCLTRKFAISNVTTAMVGNHSLTVKVLDNYGNLIEQKETLLKVSAKATSPSNEKVILCVGDSLTQNGVWPDEFSRMLTKSTSQTSYGDAGPTGLGLSNIKFIGKKITASGVRYEGYGGWTWSSYLNTSGESSMYWVTVSSHDKDSSDQESIWEDSNGVKWQLETIQATKLKFKKYSGDGVMAQSGTLTWVSGGTHTSSITFNGMEPDGANPFAYNGQIDFASYCADMGVSTIDEVYILLGWNSATKGNISMNSCKTLITKFREFNPNIKVIILGLQIPAEEGLGFNYGASGIYSEYMPLIDYVFRLDEAYNKVKEYFITGVDVINLTAQFDTEYNMPANNMRPNSRNTSDYLKLANNGLHPATSGYYQISDAVYRWFNGNR